MKLLTSLFLLLGTVQAYSQEYTKIADPKACKAALEKQHKETKSIEADFTETSTSPLLTTPQKGSGKMWYKKENKIRWEKIKPESQVNRGDVLSLIGPLPADTAFLPAKLAGFDAVLAMYHDQGLPVLKHAGFEQAVNITLGLPYPRVAVDHGTALELAGSGRADPSSLFAAADLCARLAARRMPA